jgi:hypothetical protein
MFRDNVTALFRLSTAAAAAAAVIVVVVVVVVVVVTHITLTLTQKDYLQKMKEEGRGMLQIEATYRSQLINNTEYLNIKY